MYFENLESESPQSLAIEYDDIIGNKNPIAEDMLIANMCKTTDATRPSFEPYPLVSRLPGGNWAPPQPAAGPSPSVGAPPPPASRPPHPWVTTWFWFFIGVRTATRERAGGQMGIRAGCTTPVLPLHVDRVKSCIRIISDVQSRHLRHSRHSGYHSTQMAHLSALSHSAQHTSLFRQRISRYLDRNNGTGRRSKIPREDRWYSSIALGRTGRTGAPNSWDLKWKLACRPYNASHLIQQSILNDEKYFLLKAS